MNADARTIPAVALLFADLELARPLREALQDLGARIACEGPAGAMRGEELVASQADVVVINLEDAELDHLDQLYDVLDGGDWRVIFNDAEASRDLTGWDRARWARHLASKLVGGDDVDPPRPHQEPAGADAVTPGSEPGLANTTPETGVTAPASGPVEAWHSDAGDDIDEPSATGSDQLEAELATFLDAPAADGEATDACEDTVAPAAGSHAAADTGSAPNLDIEQRQTLAAPAPVTEWELVEDAALAPAAAVERGSAADYGVEKLDPSEFLSPRDSAPDASDSDDEPVFSLELVSLEESIAPTMRTEPLSEMLLDDSGAGISHLVVLAAGRKAGGDVADFLSALKPDLRVLVLVVQHHDDADAEGIVQALSAASRLPVKTAASGSVMARPGEVWLVPSGQRCLLKRDGRLRWDPTATSGSGSDPSVDSCVEALAPVFGAEISLLVMSGGGRDAQRAARQVAQQGGQVWLHDVAAAADFGMARAIDDEGLATALGAPAELAARLNGVDA